MKKITEKFIKDLARLTGHPYKKEELKEIFDDINSSKKNNSEAQPSEQKTTENKKKGNE